MRGPLRQRSNKKRKLRVVIISLILVSIAYLLPKTISVISEAVVYPFHATSQWINNSSSLVPSFIRTRMELNEEIKRLENELVVMQNSQLTQSRLVEENNRLRQMLSASGGKRIAAAVIARPNELPYDLLQIDRGSDHGVELGAPVYLGEDLVIGLVAHVATNYSFVELVTTPGFSASAFISGPNVAVKLEGVGGGVARVKVPQGISISINDLVYLPSVEPGLFGRISHIENRPTQPEQYGYITPNTPMTGIHFVSVGQLSQISHSVEEIDERILDRIKNDLVVENISVGVIEETATTSEETVEEEI